MYKSLIITCLSFGFICNGAEPVQEKTNKFKVEELWALAIAATSGIGAAVYANNAQNAMTVAKYNLREAVIENSTHVSKSMLLDGMWNYLETCISCKVACGACATVAASALAYFIYKNYTAYKKEKS